MCGVSEEMRGGLRIEPLGIVPNHRAVGLAFLKLLPNTMSVLDNDADHFIVTGPDESYPSPNTNIAIKAP